MSGGRTPGRLGFGIIGAGPVGAVLGAALRGVEHAVVGIHAVSEASRERADAMLPQVPVLDPPELLRRSEAVVLAVPDDVLPGLVAGLAEAGHWRAGQLVLHTSARHGVDVLTPAREAGAIPLAVHPIMDFTGTSMDVQRLTGTPFGVSADPLMLPVAQALVVELGGEPVVIEEEDRAAFGAALALVRSTIAAAVGSAWRRLSELGIEDPTALLRPLIRDVADNAAAAGPAAAARLGAGAAASTVAAHVGALGEGGGDLYGAGLRLALREAVQQGRLRPEAAHEVLEALGTRGVAGDDA